MKYTLLLLVIATLFAIVGIEIGNRFGDILYKTETIKLKDPEYLIKKSYLKEAFDLSFTQGYLLGLEHTRTAKDQLYIKQQKEEATNQLRKLQEVLLNE